MQTLLTQNIKDEFNYNITQQIYVSRRRMDCGKKFERAKHAYHKSACQYIPPNATGLDLNKILLEYLMSDKKGALHEVVSEVLSYEAKKIIVT